MGIKLILLILFIFFIIDSALAQQKDLAFLHGLQETKYYQINYKALEQTYHIYVMSPEKIEQEKKYPIVYLLDGGITFPLLASYYKYLSFGSEVPEMIIVGISYGTNDWQKGNMRSRDFTAESEERSYWGGAPEFLEFFSAELFPFIEDQYPSDASQRIIFGQSLGGQFVLYAAQNEPGLFHGYIASNPALHRNLDYFIETKPAPVSNNHKPRLYVSSGSEDDPRFREPAMKWIQFWNEQESLPWQLKTATLDGQSHFSAAPLAFRQGLHWIFQQE